MSQSIKNVGTDQRLHTRSTPVVVRVGQKTWTIGEIDEGVAEQVLQRVDPGITRRARPGLEIWHNRLQRWLPGFANTLSRVMTAAVRLLQTDGQANRPSRARSQAHRSLPRLHRRRLRESFQVGLIAGLVLGCLSIVMFHQVEPSNISQQDTTPAVAPMTTTRITVPAFTMEAVVTGARMAGGQAVSVQAKLAKHHVGSSVIDSQTGTYVVTGMALSRGDLASTLKQTKTVVGFGTAKILQIHQVSKVISAGADLSQSDSNALSRWLSAVGSSLNTIVAASRDGANVRDAKAAYRTAKQLVPSHDLRARSGYSQEFSQLFRDWTASYQALVNKQPTAANISACKAIAQFMRLGVSTASS